MKLIIGSIATIIIVGLSSQANAQATVEINWDKPKKYTDVRPTNESRKRFRESTFKRINQYLEKLAQNLPDDTKLMMKVTNLDLAGQVWPASHVGLGHSASDVRVIKQIDIPRINFSYQLLASTGEIIQQADVKLKDMSFLDRANRSFKSEPLRYEKNMLQRWFKQEFSQQLSPNKVKADV
jgi:hypothetical protein